MRRVTLIVLIFTLLFSLFFYFRKKSSSRQSHAVKVRLAQDPGNLNPVNNGNATAYQIINLIYQGLLIPDQETQEIKPLLVEELPQVQKNDSITVFSFRLRKEARWPNNQPVTAADVAFSLKLFWAPLVENDRDADRFSFIKDIVFDKTDPLAFQLICGRYTSDMDLMTGDYAILPEYLVDPKGLLKEFSLAQLIRQDPSLSNHPNIIEFADWFKTERFTRNKDFVQGSGAYLLDAWKAGQYIRLKKKENWWGENLNNAPHVTANPDKITYLVIADNATALQALLKGDIDVYAGIPAYNYQQLKADQEFRKRYNLFSPESYDITYLGINGRLTKFADTHTRQALACLLNVNQLINGPMEGFAIRTVGPVVPKEKEFYNTSITPYPYDLERASRLLEQAGWVKTESGWQKNVGGRREPLSITLNYKAGNSELESIALYFQEAAAKINIPVSIQPVEGALLTDNLKSHRFEATLRYASGNPFVVNFKELLHTENAEEGGANIANFGTPESDRLLDQINVTSDLQEKARQLKRLQEILHEQSNLIFLYVSHERIAISKRFANYKVSALKPGYDVSAFTLRAE